MSTPIPLQADEQILRQERAMLLKSKLRGFGGKLYLTNQRLVFVQDRSNMFGLLGMLMSGKTAFDQPRAAIEFTRGSHGRAKDVLAVKAPDREVRFVLRSPYEEWAQALQG